jgi:hypothetical protein
MIPLHLPLPVILTITRLLNWHLATLYNACIVLCYCRTVIYNFLKYLAFIAYEIDSL